MKWLVSSLEEGKELILVCSSIAKVSKVRHAIISVAALIAPVVIELIQDVHHVIVRLLVRVGAERIVEIDNLTGHSLASKIDESCVAPIIPSTPTTTVIVHQVGVT